MRVWLSILLNDFLPAIQNGSTDHVRSTMLYSIWGQAVLAPLPSLFLVLVPLMTIPTFDSRSALFCSALLSSAVLYCSTLLCSVLLCASMNYCAALLLSILHRCDLLCSALNCCDVLCSGVLSVCSTYGF